MIWLTLAGMCLFLALVWALMAAAGREDEKLRNSHRGRRP